jgi:hypothetical protein
MSDGAWLLPLAQSQWRGRCGVNRRVVRMVSHRTLCVGGCGEEAFNPPKCVKKCN